jgi:hypothetical protein
MRTRYVHSSPTTIGSNPNRGQASKYLRTRDRNGRAVTAGIVKVRTRYSIVKKWASVFTTPIANKAGFSFVGAAITIAVAGIAYGINTTMNRVQNRVESQIRLDRCTGKYAARIQDLVEQLSASESRIQATRTTYWSLCAATIVVPAVCKAATDAALAHLRIENSIQRFIQGYWKVTDREWSWTLPFACKIPIFHQHHPFPEFPFQLTGITIAELANLKSPWLPAAENLKLSIHYGIEPNIIKSVASIEKGKPFKHWRMAWTE